MLVNFNLTMMWLDADLQYINLNEDYTLNLLPSTFMKKIWSPWVDFTNTEGNHVTILDEQAFALIIRNGSGTVGDNSNPQEIELYSGLLNPLRISRQYGKKFQCTFQLSAYPFDEQVCYMQLTMLSASVKKLIFD
ncbi:unnamed protein product, partial [Meganyctiphanes norvegica]